METGTSSSRIAVSIGAYFGTSVASFAWLVQRSLPARENRGWWQLLSDLDTFWERTLSSSAPAAAHGVPPDAASAPAGPPARPATAAAAATALLFGPWSSSSSSSSVGGPGGADALVSPGEMALFVGINVWLSSLALGALITVAVFLGRLTAAESARLSHRLLRVAVFKMVFLGHVLRGDPRDVALWLAWFAVVAYLRAFGGAAKDRLESLLTAPGVHSSRHVRAVCLLLLVLAYNAVAFGMMVAMFPPSAALAGASPGAWLTSSRALLAGCDAAVIAIDGTKTLLRYAVHMLDRYRCQRAAAAITAAAMAAAWATGGTAATGGGGGGWSGKGSFLYYVELVADVAMHGVTLAHYMHVWFLHGLSFHLSDAVLFLDMRAVLLSLLRRLRSHLSYRAATHRLNTCFRDVYAPGAVAAAAAGGKAPAAGVGGGGADGGGGMEGGPEGGLAPGAHVHGHVHGPHSLDCTICLDEISHVGKQLPCGHVFHLACLRAWLQQSGSESFTCPNCRKPIMVGGSGGAEGGGARRRSWWLVRLLDAAYVRLVVALEPLLLSLLIRLALWMGTRTHTRRRTRAAGGPAQPREGYGESPGPVAFGRARQQQQQARSRRRRGGAAGGVTTSSDVDAFAVDSGDVDDDQALHQTTSDYEDHGHHDHYGDEPDHEFTVYHTESQEDEEDGDEEEEHEHGRTGSGSGEGDEDEDEEGEAEQEVSEEVFRTQGWFGAIEVRRSRRYLTRRPRQQHQQQHQQHQHDASDAEEEAAGPGPGLAAAAAAAAAGARGQGGLAGLFSGLRRRTRSSTAHEAAAAAAAGYGGAGPGPSTLAAAPAGAHAYYGGEDHHGHGAGYDEGDEEDEEEEDHEAALLEAEAGDLVPPLRGGVAAGGRRPRAGGRGRGGGGEGRQARGGLQGLLPPAAEEVPTFSGDVLPRQAAAVARRLGATLSTSLSLRSSWGVGGVCAGAVAGGGRDLEGEDGGEVCSRPTPRRSSRRGGGAAGGSGGGGGAAGGGAAGEVAGGRRTRSAARRAAAMK